MTKLGEIQEKLKLGVSKEELVAEGFGPEIKLLEREGNDPKQLEDRVRLWIREQQKWEEKEVPPPTSDLPSLKKEDNRDSLAEPAYFFNKEKEAMYVEMFRTAERVAHALRKQAYDSLVDFVKQGEYSQAGFLDAARMQQDGDKFEADLVAYLTQPHKHDLLTNIAPALLRLESSTQIVQELQEFRTKIVNRFESSPNNTKVTKSHLPQEGKSFLSQTERVMASLAAGLALRFLSTQEAKKAVGGQPESGALEGI